MRTIFLAAALLATSTTVLANQADTQLRSLPESERRTALARIVRSAGDPCPSANQVMRQGRADNGTVIWNVGCTNGRAYAVSIKADATGSTGIMDCALLKKLNAGTCFKPY